MAGQRVAVLTDQTLLLAGITAMLRTQPDLQIKEIGSDASNLESEISAFNPAVIVVDCADEGLAGRRSLWSLIQKNPGMTVIAVTTEESEIQAYTQRRVVHARTEDLLGLIEASDLPDARGRQGGSAIRKGH